jgi:hypothetical protein
MTSISDTEVVNAPGGLVELAYKDDVFTNSITATTAATAQTLMGAVTVVCDGSPIELEVFLAGARPDTAAGNRQLYLTLLINGSRVLDQFGLVITPSAGDVYRPTTIRRRMTPTAGVHTYEVRAYVDAGTGFIESGSSSGGTLRPRSYIKVNKILQASQLLVTQSNAPIVTSLPSGNLVTGQEVDLYVTTPYAGYQRYKWNGSSWYMIGDSRGAEWQSFTPGIANITLGNGTLAGRYRVYGKTINYIGQLTWGSTTSASGYFVVNLPTNAYNSLIVGSAFLIDGGTRAWTASCAPWSAGQFYLVHTESGNFGGVNQSNPFTWGSGDYFEWNITYEMA